MKFPARRQSAGLLYANWAQLITAIGCLGLVLSAWAAPVSPKDESLVFRGESLLVDPACRIAMSYFRIDRVSNKMDVTLDDMNTGDRLATRVSVTLVDHKPYPPKRLAVVFLEPRGAGKYTIELAAWRSATANFTNASMMLCRD